MGKPPAIYAAWPLPAGDVRLLTATTVSRSRARGSARRPPGGPAAL